MYCYTPAVTFTIDGSGVNWVNLNRISGLEVPNGDERAYAEAIDKLISNPELRAEMARNAHARVKDFFLIDNMIDKMNECYEELDISSISTTILEGVKS